MHLLSRATSIRYKNIPQEALLYEAYNIIIYKSRLSLYLSLSSKVKKKNTTHSKMNQYHTDECISPQHRLHIGIRLNTCHKNIRYRHSYTSTRKKQSISTQIKSVPTMESTKDVIILKNALGHIYYTYFSVYKKPTPCHAFRSLVCELA